VYASAQSFTTGYHAVNVSIPAGYRPGMYVLKVWGADGRLLQQKLLKNKAARRGGLLIPFFFEPLSPDGRGSSNVRFGSNA
jgi:hypothetical protein